MLPALSAPWSYVYICPGYRHVCCAVLSWSVVPSSSVHGDSLGKNTGVGCRDLLQGIFPTQGSNPGLPHCRPILYQLSHKGSPRILEWVAYPFSSGYSQPRNQTGVSCIAGRFFINWAIREASWGKHKLKLQWDTTAHPLKLFSLKRLTLPNADESG